MQTLNNVHPKALKTQVWKYFHVFVDRIDFIFDFQDGFYNDAKNEALSKCGELFMEGHDKIRMYYVHEEEDPRDMKIIQIEETVYLSIGDFPI